VYVSGARLRDILDYHFVIMMMCSAVHAMKSSVLLHTETAPCFVSVLGFP